MKICVFGGGSLYRLPVYNEMTKRFHCDFYICEDNPKSGIVTYDYNDLKSYKGSFYPKRIFGNFFWLKGALKLWFQDYDLFIIGGPFCLTYWLFIFFTLFSNKKKIASWSHGLYGKEIGFRRLAKVFYYKCCSMNFVYNERAKSLMTEAGISANKIQPIWNSLDTEHNLLIRKGLKKSDCVKNLFSNNYPTLIFVGRVTKIKKLDMVLDAMAILNKQSSPINFLVVGKDVDGVNLQNVIVSKGLQQQVYLYGPCYDDEVLGNLFYNSDLCVSPGNVGLTAMSSLTFGCPVLSNDNFCNQMPEFESIIVGRTGDFFVDGNVESLASKIKKWLTVFSNNVALREEVRHNAYNEIDSKWNIYSECDAFQNGLNKLM